MNRLMKTDWHCHILPGLDDGPATIDESIEMARALADAGFTTVHCTPHCIRGLYNNIAFQVKAATRELQEAIDKVGISLVLVPGAEYYLDEFFIDDLADPLPLSGSLLLVESSVSCIPQFFIETITQVIHKGFTPLIAHPERSELFFSEYDQENNGFNKYFILFRTLFRGGSILKTGNANLKSDSLLAVLRSMGCLFQGDLGSFAGYYGERVRYNAEFLRNAGLYTHYGTDLHSIRQKGILNVSSTFHEIISEHLISNDSV